MQVYHLNEQLIAAGKQAFRDYMGAMMCGPDAMETYEHGMCRDTGPGTAVGVIAGCIEHGLRTKEQIVYPASRVTRCKRTTIDLLLRELAGVDPAVHLWSTKDGRYSNLPKASEGLNGRTFLLA